MTRNEINDLIRRKHQLIQDLKDEIRELREHEITISDDVQQYYEKEVDVVISKNQRKLKDNYLVL